jgi:pyruvate,water dikinase
VFAAAITEGRRTSGEAAAPGSGSGLIRRADAPTTSAPESVRYVLVARHPLARYAPLLWSASGLVACEGSPGAHLIEVARSLGVPAVVGCSTARPALLGTYDLAAVDGDTGIVAFASAAATYQPAPGDVEHQRPLPIGCL